MTTPALFSPREAYQRFGTSAHLIGVTVLIKCKFVYWSVITIGLLVGFHRLVKGAPLSTVQMPAEYCERHFVRLFGMDTWGNPLLLKIDKKNFGGGVEFVSAVTPQREAMAHKKPQDAGHDGQQWVSQNFGKHDVFFRRTVR